MSDITYAYSINNNNVQTWDTAFPEQSLLHLFGEDGIVSNYLNRIENAPMIKTRVVFTDLSSLMDNALFKSILTYKEEKDLGESIFYPQIFIGCHNIEEINYKQENELNNFVKKINALDNNIYTYYIPLQEKSKLEIELKRCIQQINECVKRGLYHLEVTNEYYDLVVRLSEINSLNGSHNNSVVPFVFTSETQKHRMLSKLLTDTSNSCVRATTGVLNILLIDDHAEKSLKGLGDSSEVFKNKSELLDLILKELSSEFDLRLRFQIKCISKPDIALLMGHTPDIILLDYNFNNNKSGVDFFNELVGKKKEEVPRGPFDKFWIFPITSFSNAFIDEIRSFGLGFIDKRYKLSRGADFINTPYLFKYYFSKMVLEIIETALETQQHITTISKSIQKVSEWKHLKHMQDFANISFREHFIKREHVDYLLSAQHGILKGIKGDEIKCLHFKQQLNFYEQLLYNLAYRNYEGNEEIIIFYDLLKKSLNKHETSQLQ